MLGEFGSYLKSSGIPHEFTVPFSQQRNGVAEKLNRTLIELAKALLNQTNLPNYLFLLPPI